MHAFLSNLANRQTDRQTDKRTRAKAFTSSFVEGNKKCGRRVRPTQYAPPASNDTGTAFYFPN